MYTLTNSQQKFARWLVQNVREKKLDEEFYIQWSFTYGNKVIPTNLSSYIGEKNELDNLRITKGLINALAENKLLFFQFIQPYQDASYIDLKFQFPKPEIWNCTFTSDIYKAVDNDFNSPDTSFIDYLTPLANPSGFDEELADRCFRSLATGANNPKSWDDAVRNAGLVLEVRLRDVGSIPNNRVGRDLVNDVFGKGGSLASKFSVDSEREGYRDLFAGVVGAFRNPSAHRFIDPSPEEGGAFIVFVNLLLKKLEDLR